MFDPVIRVENIGKRYALEGNPTRAAPQYSSLRETLSERAKDLFRRNHSQAERNQEFWALRDIRFEATQGEVIGIIGRNGAGKSTLLKILSRITEPTTGQVRIRGRVGSLLEVGTGFHHELTGRENIFLNGAILGMNRAEIQRKFDEIVEFAEIERFLDTPVKHFSSGMYVRLAFAVAANLEPEILLVDEVLAVGDAEFQKKCLGKMGEVSRRDGRTVLFVSHQMNAIERLCSRVLLIDNGKLQMESSDVRSVVKAYLSNGANPLSGNVEWQNHGGQFEDLWIKPERLFLADSNGNPLLMPVKNDAQIWLHFAADIRTRDPALRIGYEVHTESGEPVYRCYHNDTKPEEWPKIGLGKTTLRTQIPSRLLNQGNYRIGLIAQLHYRSWIFPPGADNPSVYLSVRGGLSDSPLWHEARPGIIAPVLGWELCDRS